MNVFWKAFQRWNCRGFQVTHKGKILILGSSEFDLDYEISDAFKVEDKVIVLLDPDSNMKGFGQFPNLLAFSLQGAKLWTAELPTTNTGDCYYKIFSTSPLIAGSFYSFICEIDIQTGRLKKKVFTK